MSIADQMRDYAKYIEDRYTRTPKLLKLADQVEQLEKEKDRLTRLCLEARCPRSNGYSFRVEPCFAREQIEGE